MTEMFIKDYAKRLFIYLLVAVSLSAIAACSRNDDTGGSSTSLFDDGKLTTEKAQSTLSRWVSEGEVTVQGVQELGKDNAAQANLSFTNFHFKLKAGGSRTYTGPGVAIFTHYNDGRWVLTKVSTLEGFNSIWWDSINLEVH